MSPNTSKRVMIVDDDLHVATILAESLERSGKGYILDTARGGEEALAKMGQTSYDLVLTDYKMPQMSGLHLAEAIHERSPDTQVVLMTAYGTRDLRDSAERLQLAGYVDKPFTSAQIREIVERALAHTQGQSSTYATAQALDQPVHAQLNALQADTGARCVLLLSSDGYPVGAVGETRHLDISSLSALIAANFAAAAELARMLGNGSVFKSSYHEGPDYNVYSYDMNGALLLAVIFGTQSKVGAVWFYAKQTATELLPLLAEQPPPARLEGDLAAAVNAEFDRLFDDKDHDGHGEGLMNVEEAVAAGLLPSEMLQEWPE